ncbi:MAG: bacterial Ig-like domain-containing protein [Bacillales bacterium]
MKKKIKTNKAKFLLLFLSVAGLTSFKVPNNLNLQNKKDNKSDLPTVIDCKDNDQSEIRNYYSYLNTLPEDQRKGENLLKHLKHIIKNNPSNPSKKQKFYNYQKEINKIYCVTDRNWAFSPKEEFSSYDSTNDKIMNFDGYPTDKNEFEDGKEPYIYTYYRDDNINKTTAKKYNWTKDIGNKKPRKLFDKEHLWSQSIGFKGPKTGAGTDLHHLVAADSSVNSNNHSNNCFANVETMSDKAKQTLIKHDGGENAILNNKSGTTSKSGKKVLFEPRNQDKGDVARALFYMAARYNFVNDDASNATIFEPDLKLSNVFEGTKKNCNGSNGAAEYGYLKDLLEWHKNDPVKQDDLESKHEIHRNNLIFNNFQFSRNPFIDFPQWVDSIWGDKLKPANPETDLLYGTFENGGIVKKLTNITCSGDPDKKDYFTGQNFEPTGLKVNANYDNGETEEIDLTLCTYSPTPLTKGTTKVTITYKGKTCEYNGITVIDNPTPASITNITVSGDCKKDYKVGENFNPHGLTITAHYSDGTSKTVNHSDLVIEPTPLTLATTQVTIKYQDKTCTINGITVTNVDKVVTKIQLQYTNPVKRDYFEGDKFDRTTINYVSVVYDDGTKGKLDLKNEALFKIEPEILTLGTKKITVKYIPNPSVKTTFKVNVSKKDKILSHIELNGTLNKKDYFENEEFDPSGLTIKAFYEGETDGEIINHNELTFTPNKLTLGTTCVDIKYKDKTCKCNGINVIKNDLINLEVTGDANKKSYLDGETFNPDGLTIKAVYKNGDKVNLAYDELEFNPLNLKLGDTKVEIKYKNLTYTYNNIVVKNFDFNEGKDIKVTEFKIEGELKQKEYEEGEKFNPEGLIASIRYSDGNFTTIPLNICTFDPFRFKLGDKKVTISYQEYEVTIEGIKVRKATPKLEKLTIEGDLKQKEYVEGDVFNPEGLIIKAHYSNNEVIELNLNDVEYSTSPLLTSTTSITFKYKGKEVTYKGLKVKEKVKEDNNEENPSNPELPNKEENKKDNKIVVYSTVAGIAIGLPLISVGIYYSIKKFKTK